MRVVIVGFQLAGEAAVNVTARVGGPEVAVQLEQRVKIGVRFGPQEGRLGVGIRLYPSCEVAHQRPELCKCIRTAATTSSPSTNGAFHRNQISHETLISEYRD
jgi:hypothetical protein